MQDPPDGWDISPYPEDTWQEKLLSVRIGGQMLVWVILAVIFVVLLIAYMRVRSNRLSR